MDAGKFDRRITLLRRGPDSDDGFTVVAGEWVELATVWAQYSPMTGTARAIRAEKIAAGEINASIPASFIIRRDSQWSDLNPLDAIRYDGRLFNIEQVSQPERGFLSVEAVARGES